MTPIDSKQPAKYSEILKHLACRKQQSRKLRQCAPLGNRDFTVDVMDNEQVAAEVERFVEEFDQYRYGKSAFTPQSDVGTVTQSPPQAQKAQGNLYVAGVTRFPTHLESIFAPMGFEKLGDKVRNRYRLASVEDRARNTGTAVYVRCAVIRMLDMVRILQGDIFSPFMQWIVAKDSVPLPRLDCGYQVEHPTRSLLVDELANLLRQATDKDQLIAGLITCFWLNFEFKLPANPNDQVDPERIALLARNHRQCVKRAVERAVTSCIRSDPSDPLSEWIRIPGGAKNEPRHQDEAEIVVRKLCGKLARA